MTISKSNKSITHIRPLLKLKPIAAVVFIILSSSALADGSGGNNASFLKGNGAYGAAGGGGGAGGAGGKAGSGAHSLNAASGLANGDGGAGADGSQSAPLTDPHSSGGLGGIAGTNINPVGGVGADGGDATCTVTCSAGFGAAGGGGGGDGYNGNSLSGIMAAISGGNGGNGGAVSTTSSGADGGSGGGGGGGAYLTGSGTTSTNANIIGGNGGNGGVSVGQAGGSGFAGSGGSAVISNQIDINNSYTLTGGNGGTGGTAPNIAHSRAGGAGGAGVAGSSFTLTNTGTIIGGDGGASGTGASTAESGMGVVNLGGAGVQGTNINIVNSGSITGGMSGAGSIQANAISFTGGVNSLELQSGSAITGNVGGSGTNTLLLGGSTNANFDLSLIGAAQQYQGFTQFQKTGASTWTLDNTASTALNWDIQTGILQLTLASALNGGSASLSGGELTFANAGTFAGNVILNQTAPINVTTGTVVLAGSVNGSAGLTKSGAGNLALTTESTYTGDTIVQAGTLSLGAVNAIASSQNVTINSGTQLDLGANNQQINNLSGAGSMQGTATLTANNSSNTTYSGIFTGQNLTKNGTGTLVMSGNGNTLSGNVLVSAGVLDWENTNTLQIAGNYTTATGATTLLGKVSGRMTVTGDMIQQTGSILDITIGASPDVTARTIQLASGAIVNINGFSDPLTGNVVARASQTEGTSYTVLQTTNGIIGFTPSLVSHPDYILVDKSLGGGNLDLVLGTRLAWTANSSQESTGSFTLAANTAFNVDIALTDQTGPFPGSGWDGQSLTKNGDGLLQLSAVNSYSGGTTINGGILEISQDANLGATSGAVTFDGGTLQIDNGLTTTRTMNLGAGGGVVDVVNGTVNFSGAMSGAGGLTKSGTGDLALTTATTYTGNTDIQTGTLSLGAANAIINSAMVTIDSGALLDLGANNQQINNLTGAGNMQGTATLTANNNSDTTYDGTFTGTNLTKTGTGALLMTGSGNILSGDVLVSAGVLNWENTDTVQIGGNYTTAAGATTSLGSTAGRMAISGDLIQAAGSTLDITIGASADVTARSAQLAGALLSVSGFSDYFSGVDPARASQIEGNSYTIIHTTDGITGFAPTQISHPDYIVVDRSLGNGNLDLVLGTRLAWTADSSQESTGSFTLASGTAFNVDVALADQTGPFPGTSWDGQSLTKNGDGLLQLSAVNSYTGGTTITGGTLEISQDANLGATSGALTFNGGTLQVDNSFSTARTMNIAANGGTIDLVDDNLGLTGTLSGSGNLTKTGTGLLNLQGDTSSYTGTLSLNQGTVNLNTDFGGSLTAQNNSVLYAATGSNLSGNLSLASGARLILANAPTATVYTAMVSALQMFSAAATTLSATTLNTFTVQGNANFSNGGVYAPSINENGASDWLSIAGNAVLTGGGLQVTALPGNYATPYRYLALTANGGVTGQFASYSISNPLLSLRPEYDANNVYLSVARNDYSISSIGTTPNQRRVGAAVDSLGGANRLNAAISSLATGAAITNALDQVSGEIYASVKSAIIEDTHFIRDAANDRLRGALNGVAGNNNAYNAQGQAIKSGDLDQAFWMHAFGSWGDLDGSDDTGAKLTKNISGVVMGSDVMAGKWRLGGLFGYTHTSADVSDRASKSTSNNYYLGTYAGRSLGMVQIRSGLIYGWYNPTVERSINFPGYSDRLRSDYRANTLQAFGEVALPQKWNDLGWEPYANLAYVHLKTGSFSENGAESALNAASQSSNTTFSTVGARLQYAPVDITIPAVFTAQLGWQHAYGDTTPQSVQNFTGGINFTTAGTAQMRNAAVFGVGMDMKLNPAMTLGVAYQGMVGNQGRENGVTGTFNWSF